MMFLSALFALAGSIGQASMPMPPALEAFADEASAWLLEGRRLPPDYRVRLMQMAPADRLQAIVFLRRAGLLTDMAWTLTDVLKPPARAKEDAE